MDEGIQRRKKENGMSCLAFNRGISMERLHNVLNYVSERLQISLHLEGDFMLYSDFGKGYAKDETKLKGHFWFDNCQPGIQSLPFNVVNSKKIHSYSGLEFPYRDYEKERTITRILTIEAEIKKYFEEELQNE